MIEDSEMAEAFNVVFNLLFVYMLRCEQLARMILSCERRLEGQLDWERSN